MRVSVIVFLVQLQLVWISFKAQTQGQTTPECRHLVGPEVFAGLQPELDPGLAGGLIIFGDDHEVSLAGTLSTWFYMTDQENGTLWVDVWRPLGGADYKLVKSYEVNVTESGEAIIDLKHGDKLSVLPGDRFGIHFINTTLTQLANTTVECYTGSVNDTPAIDGVINTNDLDTVQCVFALRAFVDTGENPCSHLYHGTADVGLHTKQTTSTYAETPGVCAIKCLQTDTCMTFNFRKEVMDDGRRTNVCDMSASKLEDDIERITDEGNFTESFYYN